MFLNLLMSGLKQTSGQSNLTLGHIAAADGRFNSIR